jgi:hydroxymethylbilane synthase
MEFEGQGLSSRIWWNFYPAAGQRVIGLEVRGNGLEIKKIVTSVSHALTWFCTAVEREFLRLLGGGCQFPLGIRSRIQGGALCCEAIFFDGSDKPRSGTVSGAFHTPGGLPRRF